MPLAKGQRNDRRMLILQVIGAIQFSFIAGHGSGGSGARQCGRARRWGTGLRLIQLAGI
jgi:hypothetical protein